MEKRCMVSLTEWNYVTIKIKTFNHFIRNLFRTVTLECFELIILLQ
jgi:hypothetical protein